MTEELNRKIAILEQKIDAINTLLQTLIDKYNEHYHDVINEPSYGMVSYPPKPKFQVK
jgi:uncharacterized coiled-coil protein SlyX